MDTELDLLENNITLYHGSDHIVKIPEFGKGKSNNDYGLGFYTTKDKGLAGEWATPSPFADGFINEYKLNYGGLSVLNLNNQPVEVWIAIVMKYRGGKYGHLADSRRYKFIDKYMIDISGYDIIEGWRADDAFFGYINAFLVVGLSLEKLQEAMKLGDLGMQVCLKSEKSYQHISYVTSYPAQANQYFKLRDIRDKKAKDDYLNMKNRSQGTIIFDMIGRD